VDIDKLTFDTRDDAALEACCDWIESEFGPIDILVNAQGILRRYNAEDIPREVWEDILDINLLSVARACQIVGKRMLQRKRGHIINIASETSLRAVPYVAAYGTSKGGIRALTAQLACEWARHGLCVNAIAPGLIPTDLNRAILEREPERLQRFLNATPANRLGVYEDLREATIFLATCTNYVNGITLPVDGGMSVVLFAAY
jgi:NAD(P)-dependent dehydrogenase (short-subunit alcohol dehydrogenase family)